VIPTASRASRARTGRAGHAYSSVCGQGRHGDCGPSRAEYQPAGPPWWLHPVALSGGGHERNQRVPHGLLHRVLDRSVEREVIDDCSDHDASAHEVPDGVADIFIVPAETVDPPDHQGVARTELVIQAATLGPLCEPRAQPGSRCRRPPRQSRTQPLVRGRAGVRWSVRLLRRARTGWSSVQQTSADAKSTLADGRSGMHFVVW
jgi:hypothetical protein